MVDASFEKKRKQETTPLPKMNKKTTNKKKVAKHPAKKKTKKKSKTSGKKLTKLQLKDEEDIAMDFAIKVYKEFNKIVKSVVLFGSAAKHQTTHGSDIDIILIIDDCTINWDQKLVIWYREKLNEILKNNSYKKNLHINTIKLSTWWRDLIHGDPVVINVIRYGKPLIDLAGFFEPLKFLLAKGEIKPSPETIYNCLQRAPTHFKRSKIAELNAIEGLYWAMVDSAHAALIAASVVPPSPEQIPLNLKETFVDKGKLKLKYVVDFRDLHVLHKDITHGKTTDLKGVEIDDWQEKTKNFMDEMTKLIKELI